MLTDTAIRKAKPKEKDFKLTDGHGLYLLVRPNGNKLWRYRYEFKAKEKLMALGSYPVLTISAAREAHMDARRILANGSDPMEVKKEQAKEEAAKNTPGHIHPFRDLALDWFEWWNVGKNERYLGSVRARLNADILPALGDFDINSITPSQVTAVVLAVEERGAADVARRSLQVMDQIFRFGITRGRAGQNPAGAFKPRDILKGVDSQNFKRVEIKDLPGLLRKIHYYDGSPVTRLALRLMALVFLRTSEMITGQWSEVDWKESRWNIPKERMKGGKRPHIVPLSRQAIAVLEDLWVYRREEGQWMFPGYRANAFMSSNTLLAALDKMGYKGEMTGHGFRGVASTVLHEHGYDSEHIELQLAHITGSDVKRAYDHSKHLAARRNLMQDWADHLDRLLADELAKSRQQQQQAGEKAAAS